MDVRLSRELFAVIRSGQINTCQMDRAHRASDCEAAIEFNST